MLSLYARHRRKDQVSRHGHRQTYEPPCSSESLWFRLPHRTSKLVDDGILCWASCLEVPRKVSVVCARSIEKSWKVGISSAFTGTYCLSSWTHPQAVVGISGLVTTSTSFRCSITKASTFASRQTDKEKKTDSLISPKFASKLAFLGLRSDRIFIFSQYST